MKKLIATLALGSALSLTACAGTDHSTDYGYESQAPYADERTIGIEEQQVVAAEPVVRAERVFETRQRK